MKMYILVRKDLSKSQQTVQASHAVAEYLLKGPETNWDNGIMVVLKVPNEEGLKVKMDELLSHKIPVQAFCEEDIGHQLTACVAVGDKAGNVLRDMPLL